MANLDMSGVVKHKQVKLLDFFSVDFSTINYTVQQQLP